MRKHWYAVESNMTFLTEPETEYLLAHVRGRCVQIEEDDFYAMRHSGAGMPPETQVLNKGNHCLPAFEAVYIGRGSMWGNPFVIGKDGTRDEVCEKHQAKLWADTQAGWVTLEQLASLHGKSLICHCAPRRCHGHTLKMAAAWAHAELAKKKAP